MTPVRAQEGATAVAARTPEPSVGELVKRASEQLSDLVRAELRTARAELAQKGRHAGIGGGLIGGATVLAHVGLMALAGTCMALLALVLEVWAAALIVTAVLFLAAAVLALAGRAQVRRAAPPLPERAIDGVRSDLDEIKERVHR
ncbi:phage holin family protein [Streptomyces somaliensis]|uniref:phage holin family protein n=1 Tax=Streptomyces somaliensis TaxID=78355 RepID=UPI0020CE01CE|nr:phage holin family protein [Streptomyces somaliensis]MCP9946265.1 phage holin family protein [Streptomyces somaliensis]